MMDLIFVILIAEAASHSLGDYNSVADGAVMIGTLVACNYAINLLTYWSPFVERLVSSPPLQVVRNGKRPVPLQDHSRLNKAIPDHIVGQLATLFDMSMQEYKREVLASS